MNLNGPWKQDQTTEGRGGVVIISASTSPVNNMVAIKTETRTSHRKMDLTFFSNIDLVREFSILDLETSLYTPSLDI